MVELVVVVTVVVVVAVAEVEVEVEVVGESVAVAVAEAEVAVAAVLVLVVKRYGCVTKRDGCCRVGLCFVMEVDGGWWMVCGGCCTQSALAALTPLKQPLLLT
jgi:hypothetical protein